MQIDAPLFTLRNVEHARIHRIIKAGPIGDLFFIIFYARAVPAKQVFQINICKIKSKVNSKRQKQDLFQCSFFCLGLMSPPVFLHLYYF